MALRALTCAAAETGRFEIPGRLKPTMARDISETQRTVSLQIGVKLACASDALRSLPAAVYAFGRSGQLIDKIATKGGGQGRLRVPALRGMQEIRIMVGPGTQTEQTHVPGLRRRGAKETVVGSRPATYLPVLEFDIQPTLSSHWMRHCLVRGTLLRHDRGVSSPIANATVEVWEIEPIELMITKLPDAVIENFRALVCEAGRLRTPDAARPDA